MGERRPCVLFRVSCPRHPHPIRRHYTSTAVAPHVEHDATNVATPAYKPVASVLDTMTSSEFLDSVRADNETELSRLGSSRSLYAATGGELDADHVLRAAADAELVAVETFDAWAHEEPNEDAQRVFQTTGDEERNHSQAIADELDDYDPDETPGAMHAHLRELESTVERAGGLLGRILVAGKSKEQLVGFFVGQADPQTADVFRTLKADVDDQRERTLDLLADLCDTDDAWNRAKTAADDAVRAAYDDYVEQLEAQGVNPKPVC